MYKCYTNEFARAFFAPFFAIMYLIWLNLNWNRHKIKYRTWNRIPINFDNGSFFVAKFVAAQHIQSERQFEQNIKSKQSFCISKLFHLLLLLLCQHFGHTSHDCIKIQYQLFGKYAYVLCLFLLAGANAYLNAALIDKNIISELNWIVMINPIWQKNIIRSLSSIGTSLCKIWMASIKSDRLWHLHLLLALHFPPDTWPLIRN